MVLLNVSDVSLCLWRHKESVVVAMAMATAKIRWKEGGRRGNRIYVYTLSAKGLTNSRSTTVEMID